ncbi:hypothetical protein V6N11_068998 [Hibiscus sabdariffa]|uniref:Uncharacterized protein n=2 Tax=Hibiscus sabdariffa TaxID=183260 RepID=A0ABR2NMK9_9ROSI
MGDCTVCCITRLQATVDEANSRWSESRVRRILRHRLVRLERTGLVLRNRVAVAVRLWNEAHSGGRTGGCTVSTLTSFSLQVSAFWVTLSDRYQLWSKVTGSVHGKTEGKVWGPMTLVFWYYGEGSEILGSLRFRVVSDGFKALITGRCSYYDGFRGSGEMDVRLSLWSPKEMARWNGLEGTRKMGGRLHPQGKMDGGEMWWVFVWMMAMAIVLGKKRRDGRLKTSTCVRRETTVAVGGERDTWLVSQQGQGMFVTAVRNNIILYDWISNDGLLKSIQIQKDRNVGWKSKFFGMQKVMGRQEIVVWLGNRRVGSWGKDVRTSGPMVGKRWPRLYGKRINYGGLWKDIPRRRKTSGCMGVIKRSGPQKEWKENRNKIKGDKYVDYGNAWHKIRGLRTEKGERKFRRRKQGGPSGRVIITVRWLIYKNGGPDGDCGNVTDRKSYEGPFQYGEWLKVDLGQQGLVRRRPGIVYKEQREKGMGLETVEENHETRAGGSERNLVQLGRGKVVTGSTARNRTVKRSLQGKNEVCNPFTAKRSKPSTSQGGVEDEKSEATSPNKSFPTVEAAGQPHRE